MTDAEAIYGRLAGDRPAPKTELHYSSAFTLLVAVVLSAQATDLGVNRATEGLFAAADTPEAMIALGVQGVAAHVRTIGLWRNKARNVVALSERLIEDFGGRVPDTFSDLMSLPGVGRKTANVVLNEAFGHATIAVDTHVYRVANRTGLGPGETPLEVEQVLMETTPERYLGIAHHLLILHGRYVCKARKPLCRECIVADLCAWVGKDDMIADRRASS